MTDADYENEGPRDSPWPVEVDAESATFRVVGSGELETVIVTPEGEPIVQMSRMPDLVYEQLVERGDISHG